MTYRQLYLTCKRQLEAAGVDPAGGDAAALTKHFFGLDRPGLALRGEGSPPPEREEAFLRAAAQRADRRPLQYILGSWEFMGLSLRVGEGVLVPREDTAVLVELLAEHLGEVSSPKGLDLCAGSGAVALGLCSLLPDASVTCVELSEQAIFYLQVNITHHSSYHVSHLRGDVLDPAFAGSFPPRSLDFIAANPPYIAASELPTLQPEVRQEPALALDGGPDGLAFYRAIAGFWAPLLKPGGLLAVEIGETQAAEVSAIFRAGGLQVLALRKDWAGLDRAILAKAPE